MGGKRASGVWCEAMLSWCSKYEVREGGWLRLLSMLCMSTVCICVHMCLIVIAARYEFGGKCLNI